MLTLISFRVGHGRAAQQTQTYDVAVDIMAVLTIVQQAHAIIAFAQINPLVGAGLKRAQSQLVFRCVGRCVLPH